MNLKKIFVLGMIIALIFNGDMVANAQDVLDESSAAYSWSESDSVGIVVYSSEPTWIMYDQKDVTVNGGTINMASYVMTLLNDTKLCRATTVHSGYFPGYVRARFETIFGEVQPGSDSGRVISFYGSAAETPSSDAGGWNGVAHTYCNSLL